MKRERIRTNLMRWTEEDHWCKCLLLVTERGAKSKTDHLKKKRQQFAVTLYGCPDIDPAGSGTIEIWIPSSLARRSICPVNRFTKGGTNTSNDSTWVNCGKPNVKCCVNLMGGVCPPDRWKKSWVTDKHLLKFAPLKLQRHCWILEIVKKRKVFRIIA